MSRVRLAEWLISALSIVSWLLTALTVAVAPRCESKSHALLSGAAPLANRPAPRRISPRRRFFGPVFVLGNSIKPFALRYSTCLPRLLLALWKSWTLPASSTPDRACVSSWHFPQLLSQQMEKPKITSPRLKISSQKRFLDRVCRPNKQGEANSPLRVLMASDGRVCLAQGQHKTAQMLFALAKSSCQAVSSEHRRFLRR